MVTINVVNALTFLIGVVFLYNGYRLTRQGREDLVLFLVSEIIGLGLIVVAIVPDVFQYVATFLGLELKARAILVIANLTLFVLVTYLFTRIGRLHDNVSTLNEELSLLRSNIDDSDDE